MEEEPLASISLGIHEEIEEGRGRGRWVLTGSPQGIGGGE